MIEVAHYLCAALGVSLMGLFLCKNWPMALEWCIISSCYSAHMDAL